jgi:hypothetical protein
MKLYFHFMMKPIFFVAVVCTLIACRQQGSTTQEKATTDTTGLTNRINVPGTANDSIPPDACLQADLADTSDGDGQEGGLWAAINSFIPEGYSMLNCTAGDLNLDSLEDRVLVLKKNGEDSTSDVVDHPEKRPLLLLIGQPGNTYKLAAKNDNVALCVDCGGMMGDPFQGITVHKGYFSVEHYGGTGWRWTRIVTFKYTSADKNWYLHKDGHSYFHATDPEKAEDKIYTVKQFGKVPFATFDVYKDQ